MPDEVNIEQSRTAASRAWWTFANCCAGRPTRTRALSKISLVQSTSRSTEKRRRQVNIAGVDRYFTKPYQEDKPADEPRGLIH
jgi:hypothetical protein